MQKKNIFDFFFKLSVVFILILFAFQIISLHFEIWEKDSENKECSVYINAPRLCDVAGDERSSSTDMSYSRCCAMYRSEAEVSAQQREPRGIVQNPKRSGGILHNKCVLVTSAFVKQLKQQSELLKEAAEEKEECIALLEKAQEINMSADNHTSEEIIKKQKDTINKLKKINAYLGEYTYQISEDFPSNN